MPDCPRCKLSLQTEQYEGHEVHFCGTCWGHWLDNEAFEQILKSEVYSFGRDETKLVLANWADHDPAKVALSEDAACPSCGEVMEQGPIDDRCPVVIDRCEKHGVWLDTSEIKQIQVFVDSQAN